MEILQTIKGGDNRENLKICLDNQWNYSCTKPNCQDYFVRHRVGNDLIFSENCKFRIKNFRSLQPILTLLWIFIKSLEFPFFDLYIQLIIKPFEDNLWDISTPTVITSIYSCFTCGWIKCEELNDALASSLLSSPSKLYTIVGHSSCLIPISLTKMPWFLALSNMIPHLPFFWLPCPATLLPFADICFLLLKWLDSTFSYIIHENDWVRYLLLLGNVGNLLAPCNIISLWRYGLNAKKPIFAMNFSNKIFHKFGTANNSYLTIFCSTSYIFTDILAISFYIIIM